MVLLFGSPLKPPKLGSLKKKTEPNGEYRMQKEALACDEPGWGWS